MTTGIREQGEIQVQNYETGAPSISNYYADTLGNFSSICLMLKRILTKKNTFSYRHVDNENLFLTGNGVRLLFRGENYITIRFDCYSMQDQEGRG